ncbi:helix-turn-helix transcriptional regulator [Butyrivibrio sp. VCD2006]|uniref:helix-turn-helix transcriptional regulator n=1 Tax=Butyrivibrio sp. VCD2006 TaxID=1280664 RepID=UPI0003F5FB2A|nr:helix-turn-helix transcriptional regulator [Butyrivibrio sp. VCD2006]
MISDLYKYLKYRPILRNWIITGLVTVLVTGLVMILTAVFMVNQLYSKEEELHEKIVGENTAIFKGICDEVVTGAQTFLGDSEVKVAMRRGDETVDDRMRISAIKELIAEYCAVHSPFGNVYLFFPKKGAVLTNSEYLNTGEDTPFVVGLNMKADYSSNLFSAPTYSKFKISGPENDRQLYYSMSTSYTGDFEDQDAVLLITIQKSLLNDTMSDDCNFILVSDDGSYVQLDSDKLNDDSIRKYIEVDGQKKIGNKMVYSSEIKGYGLRLIAALDFGTISGAVRPFIFGVILYCLVVLLLSSYSVVRFSRKNYMPIENILKFMDEHKVLETVGDTETSINNEFKQIENGINKAITNMSLSREEILKHSRNNETRLVSLLNYGKEPYEEENVDTSEYIVVSYDIDNPTGEPFKQIERDQLWFIIYNVSTELLSEEKVLATGGLAHWFYNIVRMNSEDGITIEELITKINTVCSFIREKFDIALVANISNIHRGKGEIPTANRESMLVREYRIYVGALENVAFYSELTLDDEGRKTLTAWNQMEQVQNMYRLNRGNDASNMLTEIMAEATKESTEAQPAEKTTADTGGKSAALVEKARKMVDEQYADKDLNVNSIADELNVNNSYLSRTFKQIYGTGMLEYINSVRLENAEKLMESGCTVKDAADKVGFSTPRPLIRCFRDKYGTTPGEYYKGK